MSEATYYKDTGETQVTAAAAVASGEVLALAGDDTRFGVYAGLDAAASGDQITLHTVGQFTIAAATASVFALGDLVYWDAADNECNVDSTNNPVIGRCMKASGAGVVLVIVDLNVSVALA